MSRGISPILERGLAVAPSAASAVLAVALGAQLAKLVWAFVPVPAWTPPPAVPQDQGSAREPVNLSLIVGAHLFGRYEVPKTEAAIAEAPDTRLNLKLLGILADTEAEGSRALIEGSGVEEKPYAIGDDLTRGVTLQAIFPDRVILSRAGQLETLRLEKDRPSTAADGRYLEASTADDNSAVDSAQLSRIRETLLADPSRAQQFIRVVPANVGGNQRGYRIYPGRDRSLFSAAGLRPGDLVTAVNGVELNDPARALQLLGELSQATTVNLTVERGGQQQNYTLSVN